MRSIKTVLTLIVIVLAASLLATDMAYSADHRGGGQSYRGGGQSYRGGGQSYRGGGQFYRGGGRDYRGGGHYYRGGHRYYGHRYYYGPRYGWWRPWGYYPRFYPYPDYYPYYYPSYYPYSSTVVVPSTPQTYIEREQEEYESGPESAPSGVWYYCPGPKAYYPYVKECPGGWQTVPAEPPAEPGR